MKRLRGLELDSTGCEKCPLVGKALIKGIGFTKRKELVYQLIYYQLLNINSFQLTWRDFSPHRSLTLPKLPQIQVI
jgi:hypothetical protein